MDTRIDRPTPAQRPVAQLCAVSKTFTTAGGHELKVLDNIDLAVNPANCWRCSVNRAPASRRSCAVSPGWSTPTSGRVLCDGKSLSGILADASVVFQTFALYPWLTVEQNVAVGLMSRRVSRAERDAAVDRAIELIGLGNYHCRLPARALGRHAPARRHRARARSRSPKLLCLDEAFSALDVLTAENLRQELIALWRSPESGLSSVFMVTHNIEEAVEMATRIVVVFPRPGRLGLVLENHLPTRATRRTPSSSDSSTSSTSRSRP